MFNKTFDFVTIGDTTIDAFIRIKEAAVNCDINREHCQICFDFANKVPYESVTVVPAVGNSANAAVAAARLGLRSAFVGNVGADLNGKDCINALKKNNVDAGFVKIHTNKKTNYHYVLWYGDERTILIKHEEFDYSMPDIGSPKWVYLSSLGENSLPFHYEIEKYLKARPEINLALQPGTFQMKFGLEKLAGLYQLTKVFICNLQEAQRILNTQEEKTLELMKILADKGPKIVVITDGPKGAYAYDGNNAWFMPPYPDPKPPFERTGAGDAFSSTFVAALAMGKNIKEALMMAPINSMSVVQKIGAREGLLAMPELENYLKSAPEDYKPRKIN
ncbi:MAG: carbohydrate kinase family protein [Candidatus Pacebacteria bacterium]|nr:carbohydrate kinase family protein [Candidatus Paceibacterota bacterium]NUQ57318.1 carbohydrate kinase family protein [Candidatus Paceibacter sp.]